MYGSEATATQRGASYPALTTNGCATRSIGGRRVESAADARRILRAYEEGKEMTLTTMRERAEVQLSGAVEERVRLRRRGAMRGTPFAAAGPRMSVVRRPTRRGMF